MLSFKRLQCERRLNVVVNSAPNSRITIPPSSFTKDSSFTLNPTNLLQFSPQLRGSAWTANAVLPVEPAPAETLVVLETLKSRKKKKIALDAPPKEKKRRGGKRKGKPENEALKKIYSVQGLDVPNEPTEIPEHEKTEVDKILEDLPPLEPLPPEGQLSLATPWEPLVDPAKRHDPRYMVARQRELEEQALDKAVQKYEMLQAEMTRLGKGACLRPAEKLLLDWYEPLKASIAQRQRQVSQDDSGEDPIEFIPDAPGLAPFLLSMREEKLAVVTIHTTLGMILGSPKGVPFTRVAMTLARTIQAEVNLKELKDIKQHKWLKRTGKLTSVRAINKHADYVLDYGHWPERYLALLGSLLVDSLLDVCVMRKGEEDVLDENGRPLMGIVHESQSSLFGRHRTTGVIRAIPQLFQEVKDGHEAISRTMNPAFMPMLVPPNPWTYWTDKVYFVRRSTVMRTKGVRGHLDALKGADLTRVYDALNALGSTAWRVNKRVYAVIAKSWDIGGDIAELPPRKDVPVPDEPPKTDPQRRYEWMRIMRKISRHNTNLHSLRSDTVLKLSVARDFLGERFYFPHNMDFRGRTYPLPPHLNHLGSDMNRGLLVFADGKKLGKKGFNWMKVHMANLYGKDKISLDERMKFTESSMDLILDSAKNPLGGKKWWVNAENPWQALGCCFEIADIIASKDPENFISTLPVHQDGTCNGLQHYAALGGDVYGGKEVNLLPSDRPQDVYNGVAQLVRKKIEAEAADGERLACILVGKIDRKIVKQVVMTSVYGVTFTGARQQIQNAMKDRNNLDVSDQDIWQASYYITKHVFASLGEIFNGARSIMDWLSRSAREIAKKGEAVHWMSPLGLPIMQPYKKETGSRDFVKTLVQTVCLAEDKEGLPINVGKHKSAFPPNYIHCIDSSHMMLTALEMKRRNLTYASVHDSYWTNACSVDEMSVVLREQFVALHSRPLLQELLDHWNQRYPGVYFDPVPVRGNLDVRSVMNSRYFFN